MPPSVRKAGSWRETRGKQLEDPLRPLQVLEPVLTQVAETHAIREHLPHQFRRRRREHHLPAVAGARQPRASVERRSEVMVALEFDLACVQAHAHLELAELAPRFPVKVALGAQRGRDGV